MALGTVGINQGTQTGVPVDTIGGTNYPIVKLDYGAAGASSPFTGTLLEVGNIVKGTLTSIQGGTVNNVATGTINAVAAGTITTGTVDAISQLPPNYFTTTVTSGTSTLGTIKAAISGSAIYVTDMIISVGSASNVVVGMGGTSTPFIGTLSFAANGGLTSNFRVPGSITSGSALVYQQSANGPLSITVTGFVR